MRNLAFAAAIIIVLLALFYFLKAAHQGTSSPETNEYTITSPEPAQGPSIDENELPDVPEEIPIPVDV